MQAFLYYGVGDNLPIVVRCLLLVSGLAIIVFWFCQPQSDRSVPQQQKEPNHGNDGDT